MSADVHTDSPRFKYRQGMRVGWCTCSAQARLVVLAGLTTGRSLLCTSWRLGVPQSTAAGWRGHHHTPKCRGVAVGRTFESLVSCPPSIAAHRLVFPFLLAACSVAPGAIGRPADGATFLHFLTLAMLLGRRLRPEDYSSCTLLDQTVKRFLG